MLRVVAISSLAIAFSASLAPAQTSSAQSDEAVASRYSPAPTHETFVQRQRRERAEMARELVFEKAAARAAQRDQRIATAKALGISHARPAVNQSWLQQYIVPLPRFPWLKWIAPVEYPEETAQRPAPRY